MNHLGSQRTYTADELLALPNNKCFELVDGRLVELHSGAWASYIGLRLTCRLADYCKEADEGWVFGACTSYQCFPGRPDLVRRPDASVIRPGRLPDERLPKGHLCVAPDLAAEVIAPGDLYGEIEQKVAEYRAAGVRLIWILIPDTRTVLIRRLDGTASEVGPLGELSGEDVLPGLHCRVADLFREPSAVLAAR